MLFYGFDGTTHYELEWDYSGQKPTANVNGTTGWAKIISCSSGECPSGAVRRAHRCAFDPCRARHSANKYGRLVGPPIHLQGSDWRPPGTSSEPPVSAVAEVPVSAVAEPPSPAAPPSAPGTLPAEPPPGAPGTPPGTPPSPSPEARLEDLLAHAIDSEEAPSPSPPSTLPSPGPSSLHPPSSFPLPEQPTGAALPLRCAAPPLPSKPHAAVAASEPHAAVAASALRVVLPQAALPQLAEVRVLDKLMALAREIRKPRAYVGYSAFVCFALAQNCRPHAWEGDARIDLVETYAPMGQKNFAGAIAWLTPSVAACWNPQLRVAARRLRL